MREVNIKLKEDLDQLIERLEQAFVRFKGKKEADKTRGGIAA